jgi:hypothetical protein
VLITYVTNTTDLSLQGWLYGSSIEGYCMERYQTRRYGWGLFAGSRFARRSIPRSFNATMAVRGH